MLMYPPTPDTWQCRATFRTGDGVTVRECAMWNSGSRRTCSMCTARKPRKPKLMWPSYVRAAVKAGIDPELFGKPYYADRPVPDTENPDGPVKRPRKRGKTS